MLYLLFIGFFIFYFCYTILYAIKFNKKDIYFTKGQKIFHNIMIWIIPFLWISFLKSIERPIPGSYEFEDKKTPEGYKDNETGTLGGSGTNIPWN